MNVDSRGLKNHSTASAGHEFDYRSLLVRERKASHRALRFCHPQHQVRPQITWRPILDAGSRPCKWFSRITGVQMRESTKAMREHAVRLLTERLTSAGFRLES